MSQEADITEPPGLAPIPGIYTVAEIAAAVGRSRQAVHAALKHVPTSLQKILRGQKQAADAWPFRSFPERLRLEVEAMTKRQGRRNPEHLLQDHAQPWEPPVSWDKVAPHYRERAEKLRSALAELLPLQHSLSAEELQERGLLEYHRAFGHPVQPRTWRRLLDRTVERDRFREDWQRLAIYLDDEAFQQSKTSLETLKLRGLHRPLDEIIRNLENPSKPTAGDRAWLFDSAFAHFEKLLEGRTESDRRSIKASLLDFLLSAVPSISRNRSSFCRLFDRNYKAWVEGGRNMAALEDGRRLDSGYFRGPDRADDYKAIRNLASQLGGNESLAHRRLRKEGKLSREFCDYHTFDLRRNKSYVPRAARQAVTGDVEIALPFLRGPKQARLAAPHIQRDWSDAVPGDVITADDVCWNHVFWDLGTDGRAYITRGECLLFTDELTDTPLAFSLHGLEDFDPTVQKRKASYNQVHIRRGMLKVHDDHGLPDIGWRFEGGTWQARLIRGDNVTGALHLHWRDTAANCNGKIFSGEDAQKILHATTPRAKVIERTLLTLQQEMRADPAFVGFDERREKFERMQEIIRKVRAGTEHPGNVGIPHRDDFVKRIHERLQEFMHEPQNGKRHHGASPWELWQERISRKPLRKLPDQARWIFASHFKRLRIRNGRITLRDFMYSNEATVAWNRREVMAFFNIEQPHVLVFSDLDRTQFFAVKAHVLPSRGATPEQFAAARQDLGAHRRKAREIYQSVMHPVKSSIVRDEEHSETTKRIGRLIKTAVAEHDQATAQGESTLEKIRRNCERLGREMPVVIRHPASFLRGQEMELAELRQNRNEANHE